MQRCNCFCGSFHVSRITRHASHPHPDSSIQPLLPSGAQSRFVSLILTSVSLRFQFFSLFLSFSHLFSFFLANSRYFSLEIPRGCPLVCDFSFQFPGERVARPWDAQGESPQLVKELQETRVRNEHAFRAFTIG